MSWIKKELENLGWIFNEEAEPGEQWKKPNPKAGEFDRSEPEEFTQSGMQWVADVASAQVNHLMNEN